MKRSQRLVLAAAACLGVLGVTGSARAESLINPKAVSWGANRLDVFAVGASSGALYHKAWDGSQWWPAEDGPWEALGGGGIVGAPTVVSWGANRLDIFVVGADHALYHKAWYGGAAWYPSQSGFENLGGAGIVGSPTAVSREADRLDIFIVGNPAGTLYHKAWDGSRWYPSESDWERLGSGITGTPAVASWGPSRLDVFAVGGGGALYHKWWDGANWYPQATVLPNSVTPRDVWENLGGVIIGSPTVASWGANRLDIFVLGTDRGLYHKAWAALKGVNPGDSLIGDWYPSQGSYDGLGGEMDSPTVVAWGANRLDIFAVGYGDRVLYHKAWSGTGWYPSTGGWASRGGIVVGAPTTVSWGANRLDTFVAGLDGAIYHKAWDGANWYPSVSGYERLGDSSAHLPPVTTPPTPTPTPTPPPAPATPSITVSQNGSVYTVTGLGFLHKHPVYTQVTVRVIVNGAATLVGHAFPTMSNSSGVIGYDITVPCDAGAPIYFSANDGRLAPVGGGNLWSNSVMLYCM